MSETSCNVIQWERLETRNGNPVCPECGEPAEKIVGFMGEPCWAHKAKENGDAR